MNPNNPIHTYAEIYKDAEYEHLDWKSYFETFKELEEDGSLIHDLPRLSDAWRAEMRARWGAYDDDGYEYLERLYQGLLNTQSVSGALQSDQAIKLCKISYEVDKRIEEGSEFDKLLGSYEKLVKVGEFTPKNVKNANDFESIGEVIKYMEAKGWRNQFYDGETRDVVDETIKSMQTFNRRLYTQEVSIGDEITRRLQALKTASDLERNNGYYGLDEIEAGEHDEHEAYEGLVSDDEEFDPEGARI